MGYGLIHREDVAVGVRRVMIEQLDKAREALGQVDDAPAEAIHQCRKRCKKIRAAVRLVRPAVVGDSYDLVNHLARDAGRALSRFRDATATSATFDRLDRRLADTGISSPAMRAVRPVLAARRRTAESEPDADHSAVAHAADLLDELESEIRGLELDTAGWDAIGPGLAKTYGRGRNALADVITAPTAENHHELRKRAKYTRAHVDLLASAAPTILQPLEQSYHDLTDALGDAHDLAVIGEWLRSHEAVTAGVDDANAARVLVAGTRSELEWRAVLLGERLYAESAKRFSRRVGAYWAAWSGEEFRRPAGDLDVAFG